MNKIIYDITIQLHNGMIVFPGDPETKVETVSFPDSYKISSISMSIHSGTHIDAPAHFFNDGITIDRIPVETFLGSCYVADMKNEKIINRNTLEKYPIDGIERLLLKTANSELWDKDKKDCKDYVHITKDAGEFLASLNIRLLGFDYLSVDSFEDTKYPVHYVLLGKGIVILENLNLSAVPEGNYELICLPLKIRDAEAAPARALLIKSQ